MSVFSDSLLLPAFCLAVVAFMVPRILGRVLPEGVALLMLNAFLSAVLLFVISASLFVCLYLWQGQSMSEILAPGLVASVLFFGKLGLAAGIIWAPITVLSVAGLPRKWVKETW